MMTMTEEPDFNHALSCLDDFDVDESFEALLKGHDLFVKQEGGAHNGHLQAKSSGVHGVKRHSHHRPGVAGGKRSFKDYTKPIKRGFLNRQIPANDIRRFLAQIVVHACNLHNPDHLATVLKEYCGPSVVLNTRFIGNADTHPIKNAIMYRELHGIGHITRYFDALLQAVPDGVIKLLDSKVHMFQNGCSYIVGKFVFKGQKCFDLVTVGDTKDKRAVPSKFDRRSVAAAAAAAAQARQLGQMGNSNCGSLFSPTPLGHYGSSGSAMDPFHFLSESAVMLDLEAFLLDDMDGDDQIVFGQPPASALQGGALTTRVESQASLCSQSSDKTQTMSVALENKPIEFYVPHSRKEVQEVPLSLLGTMAFYLDPDAKIFKIEVLHALEGNEKERHNKKARRS